MAKGSRAALFGVIGISVGLGGCANGAVSGWSNRYGPDPAFPSAEVSKSADNQVAVLEALKVVSHNSAGQVDPYLLTLAGFNFVDEQCDAYLHELFVIDQDRDRLKQGIDVAGLVTNAILAATPASKASMAIVAQALGLSSQFTDTVANSYLFMAPTHRRSSASSASCKPLIEIRRIKTNPKLTQNRLCTIELGDICSYACRQQLKARSTTLFRQALRSAGRPRRTARQADPAPQRRQSSLVNNTDNIIQTRANVQRNNSISRMICIFGGKS